MQVYCGVEFGCQYRFGALFVEFVDQCVGYRPGGVDDCAEGMGGGDGGEEGGQLVAVGDVGGGEFYLAARVAASSVRSWWAPGAWAPRRLTSSRCRQR